MAKKVLALLNRPFFFEHSQLVVSASIGICIYEDAVKTDVTLAQAANAAMYKVKYYGRNSYLFFSEEHLSEQKYRTDNERGSGRGWKMMSFFVCQPKINIQTGSLPAARR